MASSTTEKRAGPSKFRLALALTVILTKPVSLSAREYVVLLREQIKQGTRMQEWSSNRRYIDVCQFWQTRAEKNSDEVLKLQARVMELEAHGVLKTGAKMKSAGAGEDGSKPKKRKTGKGEKSSDPVVSAESDGEAAFAAIRSYGSVGSVVLQAIFADLRFLRLSKISDSCHYAIASTVRDTLAWILALTRPNDDSPTLSTGVPPLATRLVASSEATKPIEMQRLGKILSVILTQLHESVVRVSSQEIFIDNVVDITRLLAGMTRAVWNNTVDLFSCPSHPPKDLREILIQVILRFFESLQYESLVEKKLVDAFTRIFIKMLRAALLWERSSEGLERCRRHAIVEEVGWYWTALLEGLIHIGEVTGLDHHLSDKEIRGLGVLLLGDFNPGGNEEAMMCSLDDADESLFGKYLIGLVGAKVFREM